MGANGSHFEFKLKFLNFKFNLNFNCRPRGAPNIAKMPKRRCHFEEFASPKYGNHHYIYDRKYDQVTENTNTGLIPFDKMNGFGKDK